MIMIVLASQSPRRKEIMEQVGLRFLVHPTDVDEMMDESLPIPQAIERLALAKAEHVATLYPNDIVIGADTLVCLDKQVLGKPQNAKNAKEMLQRLSGQTHQVITGVAICADGKKECFHSVSDVTFYSLSDREITAYIDSKEPFDKAGAYGIQGKGAVFVAKIVGDYYNIVGLPIAKLMQRLKAYE